MDLHPLMVGPAEEPGSLVSREASDKEKGKDLPTLKDIDFLNMNQKVYISEEAKKDFMEKLKRDVEDGTAATAASYHQHNVRSLHVVPTDSSPKQRTILAFLLLSEAGGVSECQNAYKLLGL
uniref:Uncharacterized protein n=1 Tax=Sphaerodactylus townsendi TaxID=933632 RepID=A0ACB8EP32_9SAUR